MWDVILDTVIDSVKLIPFLFLTYLVMEYLENKAADKMQNAVKKAGKFRPKQGRSSKKGRRFPSAAFRRQPPACMPAG